MAQYFKLGPAGMLLQWRAAALLAVAGLFVLSCCDTQSSKELLPDTSVVSTSSQHGVIIPLRRPESINNEASGKVDSARLQSIRKHLQEAQSFYLISIDNEDMENPSVIQEIDSGYSRRRRRGSFHNWGVLGRTQLASAPLRDSVIDQLCRAIAEHPPQAFCFEPRHGIRAVHGGDTIDLVICFECQQWICYPTSLKVSGGLSDIPEPLFNRILRDRGVPISPP